MKFRTPHSGVEFEIPDEWWMFAEMHTFRPDGGGFYPYSAANARRVEVVSLSSIEPPTRNDGVPLLKKYKLVPVLFAFQSPDCALPPVEVKRLAQPTQYQYQVQNGFHRFYASVAAGYKALPVVVVPHVAF